jgi:signal peptidase complex subunit 3
MRLEVDYDLSSCASWNTKMVFAHVTVSWETETRGVNEATIWDDAVKFDRWESAESKAKKLRKQGVIRAKYKLRSVDERLSGRGMEVKLRWAVTPRAGRIWRGETSTSNATFPVEYLNVGGDGQRARAAPRTPGMP